MPKSVIAGKPTDFDRFGPGADGKRVVGAAFTFRISGGGQVLYELQGSVDLLHDETGANVVVDRLDAARQALNGFRMVSVPDSKNEVSFVWDATDLLVNFAPDTLLQPGESSTLSYETEVSTYSFATCTDLLTGACLGAYSSFGDPIGRGGAALPAIAPPADSRRSFSANASTSSAATSSAATSSAATSSEIHFATFAFRLPEFRKGVLSYDLIPSEVPTPPALTLLLLGLVGAALASRRPRR